MREIGRELEVLREVALATSATQDAEEILRVVREHATSLFRADYGGVFLALEGDEDPVASVDAGEPPTELRALLRDALEAGESRALTPAVVSARTGDQPVAEGAICTGLALPLRFRDEVHGVLVIGWCTMNPVAADTIALAETLGVQAAVALHNARLYAEIQRSTAARDRFFSAMSHDLRTPIAAIVGYSELLSDGIVGELSTRQHEMIERISQVAAHLSELVDGILDLARLDAGRMELQPDIFPVLQVVEEAALDVRPQAESKGLTLHLEMDRTNGELLEADPVRVRQILVNLLSNAVKFTEEGSVEVHAETRGGRVWITVRDTGPGLPEGMEEAVFEEFMQVAAGRGSKQKPGSGLGLAVSRRLARAMGGNLTVESNPSAGAAFTLSLPRRRESGIAATLRPSA